MAAIEFVFTLILRIEQAVQISKRAKKGKNRIIVLSFQNSIVFDMEIYGDLAVVVIDIVGYVSVTLSSFILISLLFFNLAFGQCVFSHMKHIDTFKMLDICLCDFFTLFTLARSLCARPGKGAKSVE